MADASSWKGKGISPEAARERVKREVMKPLVFGNHQKKFKAFTFAVSAAMTLYLVFMHDFGEQRHCFTWFFYWMLPDSFHDQPKYGGVESGYARLAGQLIREYAGRKKKQFFSIDPNDEEFIKMKEKHKN